jgi:hypothetical protein
MCIKEITCGFVWIQNTIYIFIISRIQSHSLNRIISGTPINEIQLDIILAEQLVKSILTTTGKSNNYTIEILIALRGKLCGVFIVCN